MLGGGESQSFKDLKEAAGAMHRNLFVSRRIRASHQQENRAVIDLGTDQRNNVLNGAEGPQVAMEVLRTHAELLREYPSCFGTDEVRKTIQAFMKARFDVTLNRDTQLCLTQGTTQAFDTMAQTFAGRYVVLPRFSIFTVAQAAAANGAECVRAPHCEKTGFFHLEGLGRLLRDLGPSGVRFIYLNSPSNPEGKVAKTEYLERLVALATEAEAPVLHDMDCWGGNPEVSKNILSVKGAMECSVSAITPSKELGLPGVRVGFLAGNAQIITRVQRNNEWRGVMIPGANQAAFAAALGGCPTGELCNNSEKRAALEASFEGWRRLGWPEEKIYKPGLGYKYLVDLPPAIQEEWGAEAAELLEFEIFRRTGVKLSTTHPFNPRAEVHYLRTVVSQDSKTVRRAFGRMEEAGIHYRMSLGDETSVTYKALAAEDTFLK